MDGACDLRKSSGWLDFLATARHDFEEEDVNKWEMELALPQRRDFLLDDANFENEGMGLKRFKCFENLLESAFVFGKHHFERKFHEICKIVLAQIIFGPEEWAVHADEIMRERGWKRLSKLGIGTAPRRFGKSVALAKAVVSLAYVMLMFSAGLNRAMYNITVFSTGRRASELFSDYVKTFMDECDLLKNVTVEKWAMEKITLEHKGMRVTFMFLPANPDTYVFFSLFLFVCVCFVFVFQKVRSELFFFSSTFLPHRGAQPPRKEKKIWQVSLR